MSQRKRMLNKKYVKTMLQYLVILLDDTSVAYCHAENPLTERHLIPLETLRKAILFGMKENLMIQYVLPEYELPEEYKEVMESIDNVKIGGGDVRVVNGLGTETSSAPTMEDDVALSSDAGEDTRAPRVDETPTLPRNMVLRLKIRELIEKQYDIALMLGQVERLNICLTDIEAFTDELIEPYKKALSTLNAVLVGLYKQGKQPQVNILTDRLQLTEMHNCGAGISNITLAPNGRFYLCPAFYYDEQMGVDNRLQHTHIECSRSVGDLDKGIEIPNRQLLTLERAPLCRKCDAYHCNRCIWLNQRLTWDSNTPSRQQCVLAHLERNAARELQKMLREAGFGFADEIKEIGYLDPFEVREEN